MSISLSLPVNYIKLRLKKVFALSVLFFILFNTMGYYILFELDKLMVKKEMKARISEGAKDMVCLKIEGGEKNLSFQRLDKNEIRFNGRLYDVVREIDKGDLKLIFCIPDTKEDQLYSGLKRINHDKQRLNLWDHMVTVALPEEATILEYITPENRLFPPLKIHILSSVLLTLSPPPKFS
jgi:hypothetical protein